MSYIVASVGKYHRPSHIYSRHRKKSIAIQVAKELSKKHKREVGVFEYDKYKYYGLIKSYTFGR